MEQVVLEHDPKSYKVYGCWNQETTLSHLRGRRFCEQFRSLPFPGALSLYGSVPADQICPGYGVGSCFRYDHGFLRHLAHLPLHSRALSFGVPAHYRFYPYHRYPGTVGGNGYPEG